MNWIKQIKMTGALRCPVAALTGLVLFAGCATQTERYTIRFREGTDVELRAGHELQVGAELSLGWAGKRPGENIYALSSNVAFLHGSIRGSTNDSRALLLRSSDAGQTWTEVLPYIKGSTVLYIRFISPKTGWALTGWTVEGAGALYLCGTTDGGKHWERISEVPKRFWDSWPKRFEFFTETTGQILMHYQGLSPKDGVGLLETRDGGRTWEEVFGATATDWVIWEDQDKLILTFARDEGEWSEAPDGSQWRILYKERDEGIGYSLNLTTLKNGPRYFVQRRLNADAAWEKRCTLHASYPLLDDWQFSG